MKKQQIPLHLIKNHDLTSYINKTVDINYHGEKIRLFLSHALFSSYDVDAGTKLLLKTIAQNIDFSTRIKIKDVGCGTGIIGICLKKKHPGVDITFSDRDAIALAFTEENCHYNGIKDVRLQGELGICGKDYNLILSNVPAKMGQPVLEEFIKNSIGSLCKDGICAIVVIDSIATDIKKAIEGLGGEIILTETTNRHTVYHFRSNGSRETTAHDAAPFPGAYLRKKSNFSLAKTSYPLKTVYNLPDFERPGFQSTFAAKISRKADLAGSCLFWNPGQGHISSFCRGYFKEAITGYTFGGRDLLQLSISAWNLTASNIPEKRIKILHLPLLKDVKEKYNHIILFPNITPLVPWHNDLLNDAAKLLKENGTIVLSLKSTYATRVLQYRKGFQVVSKIKDKGYTAALLKLTTR